MNMAKYDRNAGDLNEYSLDKLEKGFIEELYRNNCTATDFDTFYGLANAKINLQCSGSSSACKVTFPDGIRVSGQTWLRRRVLFGRYHFHMFMPKCSYATETGVIPCPDIYKQRSNSLADWLCMPMPCGAAASERVGFFPTALPQSYRRHKRPAIQLLYLAHTNSRQTSALTPAYHS
jgi:hypothetical protein